MPFEEAQLSPAVDAVTLAHRDAENQAFLKSFELQVNNGRVISGGDSDRQRDRLVREKWQHLYKIGWENAVIVNCLAWPLDVHTTFGYFRVPAPDRKKNELFHTYEVKVPSMDIRDLGDAKFVPEPVMPIEIAQEFERKYREEGGVFIYNKPRNGPERPENFGEMLATAQERLKAWYKMKYTQAKGEWARSGKNPMYIDDRMKDAAHFLYNAGEISELPEWVTFTKEDSTQKECPACGEIVRKTAKICKECGYAIDAEFARENAHRFGSSPAGAKTQQNVKGKRTQEVQTPDED